MKNIAVIIVAAGQGSRAGDGPPKQYRNLCGQPVIRRTVAAVRNALPEVLIQIVYNPSDQDLYHQSVEGLSLLPPVAGGSTRQASVLNGIRALDIHSPDVVLVHDAARPFLSQALVDGVLQKIENGAKAVIPTLPVVDTLNLIKDGCVASPMSRDGVHAVQTPQGFNFQALKEAHHAFQGAEFTDDGSVMEAAGHKIHVSMGSADNFKITHRADFKKAEKQIMMELGDVRVGSGYDVHRFENGDHVWLGGVKIPFNKSLKGHSDADVALHALTDALFASVSAGDIGTHFPPTDQRWRGAASDIFLKKAADLIGARDGVIAHIAVCIICERPKIGPHKDAMRERIAEILQIPIDRVSVQATTTEKLGFTGREEGIAAEATATVRLPFE